MIECAYQGNNTAPLPSQASSRTQNTPIPLCSSSSESQITSSSHYTHPPTPTKTLLSHPPPPNFPSKNTHTPSLPEKDTHPNPPGEIQPVSCVLCVWCVLCPSPVSPTHHWVPIVGFCVMVVFADHSQRE